MVLRAGQEIDAYCTKCKLDLTHKIVAMVGDRPAKVECRTCYTVHVYRAPKSAVKKVMEAAAAPRTARAPSADRAHRKPSAEDHAPVVPPSHARVHSYRMTERFEPDQWIVHKTFGNGLVLREVGPDKIEVRFDSGVKTLVHNRVEG